MKAKIKVPEIKERLLLENKSQTWLAETLEISQSYTSNLLQGKRNPSAKLRDKLQTVFDCGFHDLFEIENPQ